MESTILQSDDLQKNQSTTNSPPITPTQNSRKIIDSGIESGGSVEFDFDEDSPTKSEKWTNLERENQELQRKLNHERQLCAEMTAELKKVIEDRNQLKCCLSSTAKERDILQLKCQELQQRVGILQSAEKARLDLSLKRTNSKTDAGLKKIGLTEDILLALPFGYATKVRSAFEKLSYENEKLQEALNQMRTSSSGNGGHGNNNNEQEVMLKFDQLTKEKEDLRQKVEVLTRELEQMRNERQKSNNSLVEVLKNCAALSSLNSNHCCLATESRRRRNSDPSQDGEQGLTYDVLKIRCNLLSQINTHALFNARLRPAQGESSGPVGAALSYPSPLNYQHWSQQGYSMQPEK